MAPRRLPERFRRANANVRYPDGISTRAHRVVMRDEKHEAFASLDARTRGALIANALANAEDIMMAVNAAKEEQHAP